MADKIHRFLLETLSVRGEWIRLDQAWQEIQATKDYPPSLLSVLGEALAAISLLAASLKFKGSLILQMNNTQPVTLFVVQATSDGALRAIASWEGEITENASFKDLFGSGNLAISVEPEKGGDRYQSLIALHDDSLAETLSDYFEQSEQLSTKLWLTANKSAVSGLMLQTLPTEECNDKHWHHALALANTVSNEELQKLNAETLLHRLYHEQDCRLYDAQTLRFECTCSQKKVEEMVYSLGEEEARSVLIEQGSIEIDCQFCNQHYRLDSVDVAQIFNKETLHKSSTMH